MKTSTSTIYSQTSYITESNAALAGKYAGSVAGKTYVGTRKLPSGKFCFVCTVQVSI